MSSPDTKSQFTPEGGIRGRTVCLKPYPISVVKSAALEILESDMVLSE